MGRPRKRQPIDLTDKAVEGLKFNRAHGPTQIVYDKQIGALGVRVYKSGRKAWVLHKRVIGTWPQVTAAEARARALATLGENKPIPGRVTWAQCMADFEAKRRTKTKKYAAGDVKWIREYHRHIGAALGSVPMADSHDKIKAFLRQWEHSPSKHNKVHVWLNRLWRWAARDPELLGPGHPSPVQLIEKLDEGERRKRVLSRAEVDRLIAAAAASADPYVGPWVAINYWQALRAYELRHVKIADVDMAGGWLWLRNRKSGDTDRQSIMKESRKALGALLSLSLKDNPWLLPSPKLRAPKPVSEATLYKRFRDVAMAAKVDEVVPHDLRRARATHLRDRGVSTAKIRLLTGHNTEQSLLHYLGRMTPKSDWDDLDD